jgi:hypothetical protein
MKTFRIYSHPKKSVPIVVKVGFSWPAFIFGPLWFLANKMWMYFAIVTVFAVGARLYFGGHEPSSDREALLMFGMSLLYFVGLFFIGKVANFLLSSGLEDQGYVLQRTVTAKNARTAREEAEKALQSSETDTP